jgi:hypothetical protein
VQTLHCSIDFPPFKANNTLRWTPSNNYHSIFLQMELFQETRSSHGGLCWHVHVHPTKPWNKKQIIAGGVICMGPVTLRQMSFTLRSASTPPCWNVTLQCNPQPSLDTYPAGQQNHPLPIRNSHKPRHTHPWRWGYQVQKKMTNLIEKIIKFVRGWKSERNTCFHNWNFSRVDAHSISV